NQNAVNQTFAPGAVPLGKTMSIVVFAATPSNFHSASSVGGVAPTKLKTDAPFTPSGLPRFFESPAACRRSLTVFPLTERMSITGASAGGGIGVRAGRGSSPSATSCASVTVGVEYAIFARLIALTRMFWIAMVLASTVTGVRVVGLTAAVYAL